jgi:hypothetical protein
MCWHPLARKLQQLKQMSDTEKLAKAPSSGLIQPHLVRLTYSEWNAKGRRIHKGRGAKEFKDGEAIFEFEDTYIPGAWLKVSAMLGLPEPGEWSDPPH